MAKSNSVITSTIAEDGQSISFVVKGCDPFVLDLGKVSPIVRSRAELHGWVQRISDGAALSRDTADGKPATPEAKRARMLSIAEFYMSGGDEWRMPSGGGGRVFDIGRVVLGMVRGGVVEGVDAANEAIDKLAAKRGIDRVAAAKLFAGTSAVIEALAAIDAAKAPTGADDLLAEIGEDDGEPGEPANESE